MKTSLLATLATLIVHTIRAADSTTLKDQLDARRAEFQKSAPADKAAAYQAGIDAVANSGIYERLKKVGEQAPDFTLNDAAGQPVTLSRLLEKGPVVLTWYRGGWCPYCNLALRAMQQRLADFQKLGGQLVALTPELPEYATKTQTDAGLEFHVLSDVGNRVARAYGAVFKMTPEVANAMRKGAKTDVRNGDESDELPLALTCVVGRDGVIRYLFADADYRYRAEPSRILDALRALQPGCKTRSATPAAHLLGKRVESALRSRRDRSPAHRGLRHHHRRHRRDRTRRVQRLGAWFPRKDARAAAGESRLLHER